MPIWRRPQKPKIVPEVWAELERHGVEAMRELLAKSADPCRDRETPIRLGNVVATRGEVEDWLKWKTASVFAWLLLSLMAVLAGVIAAFAGCSVPSW